MDEVRKLDVVIDSCRQCGGIWLDEGELDKLRKHVEASRRESVDDDREKRPRDSHYDERSSHDKHSATKKKKSVFDLFEMFGEED